MFFEWRGTLYNSRSQVDSKQSEVVMDEMTRKLFSAYVADLRDTADRDYLVARISSRLMLAQAAAWSGLQAIEKYFKTIPAV